MLPLPTASVLQGVDDGTPAGGWNEQPQYKLGLFSASCLSSPDDGWVELTGVKVDETEGDGNGKLPRHGQSDGQGIDVLQKGQKTEVDLNVGLTSSRKTNYSLIFVLPVTNGSILVYLYSIRSIGASNTNRLIRLTRKAGSVIGCTMDTVETGGEEHSEQTVLYGGEP